MRDWKPPAPSRVPSHDSGSGVSSLRHSAYSAVKSPTQHFDLDKALLVPVQNLPDRSHTPLFDDRIFQFGLRQVGAESEQGIGGGRGILGRDGDIEMDLVDARGLHDATHVVDGDPSAGQDFDAPTRLLDGPAYDPQRKKILC